jgi:hypothetical protein
MYDPRNFMETSENHCKLCEYLTTQLTFESRIAGNFPCTFEIRHSLYTFFPFIFTYKFIAVFATKGAVFNQFIRTANPRYACPVLHKPRPYTYYLILLTKIKVS